MTKLLKDNPPEHAVDCVCKLSSQVTHSMSLNNKYTYTDVHFCI